MLPPCLRRGPGFQPGINKTTSSYSKSLLGIPVFREVISKVKLANIQKLDVKAPPFTFLKHTKRKVSKGYFIKLNGLLLFTSTLLYYMLVFI